MMDDAVEGMALPGGALECTCGEIIYDENKKARNWSFECPQHGLESEWFRQKVRDLEEGRLP